jgi:hypothetical protein
MADIDHEGRISRLEVRLEKLDKIEGKVDELHELFLQAKGAKYAVWSILALAAVMGAKFVGLLGFAVDIFKASK